MAAKKKIKTKTKGKKAKKSKARKAPAKRVARKAAAKKVAPKKKPKAAVANVAPAAAPSVPAGDRVGVVTHYYNHLQVAIVQLESGSLRVGDTVHIKGHTTDFKQRVDSMEVEHAHVEEVGPGKSFGLRVMDHAREHDVVYKVAS